MSEDITEASKAVLFNSVEPVMKKTKSVKFGAKDYEIPAHMNKNDMVEIWQNNSEELERLILAMVEKTPGLASKIASAYAEKQGFYFIPKEEFERLYARLRLIRDMA